MKPAGLLLLGLLVFSGCRTAHNVAVTSFRVLDAPANYVRKHIDGRTETTTTTTTASSDAVTNPGRTVTPSTANTQRTTTTQNPPRTTVNPSPKSSPATVTEKSKPSPSPSRTTTTQTQIPTAKPVPGKPGYVFSPFDPSGGYVDVTGYTSGQKVKDPYSGKIFLVP
ncbi:MAG: hypothetical protein DME97_08935 [Verrucomicrobia bacterium]|nr:MAG: hypothetical protein DME97_08935 [Verrucomicrobiota bacterium]